MILIASNVNMIRIVSDEPGISECFAAQLSMEEAVASLTAALAVGPERYVHYDSGIIRWEVPLPRGSTALQWLQVMLILALDCPAIFPQT